MEGSQRMVIYIIAHQTHTVKLKHTQLLTV